MKKARGTDGAARRGAERERGGDKEKAGELFVWGLEKRVTADQLRAAFERVGPVRDARVIVDPGRCGPCRGGLCSR